MDPEKNNTQIESAEELEAEKSHLAEVKEDEIRSNIVKEFGFDPEADKERIEKLVQKELGYKKTISTAIGQKVKYRTKVQEYNQANNPPKPKEGDKNSSADVDTKIQAALEADRLEAMEYPDEIKAIIKNVAEINKISVRKAVSDPYVQSRIEAWKKDSGADDAAAGRKNQSGGGSGADDLEIPDYDLTTEEGRKSWDQWKKDQKAKGN